MLAQRTLQRAVSTVGIGLHSGQRVGLTLRPAAPDTGIVYRRIDLDTPVTINCTPRAVGETVLSTTLVQEGVKVGTIEHLMSAFAGLGIDNVYVDLTASEVPVMDGSSAPFIYLIQSAGIETQCVPKKFIKVKRTVRFENQAGWAELRPYEGFRVSFEIDFDHPAIRSTEQVLALDFSKTSYSREISRARTFGFMRDVEYMRARNLGLGGSLGNAVVLDEYRVLNKDGLRYDNEFVKHKMLDAVGDLYTIGHSIIGAYHGYKSGHAINNLLLHELIAQPDAWELVTVEPEKEAQISYAGELGYA
ncbi:MAG: UDP-3-O-[3-hydroxymyristoyl] N-acetylglucosamine deacetylase [Proteobacteria bacterium]|nr:MAG: UDP-3-O-[3-hydroxymyristoyl] N-acetylglucosamine deacetylase [Pseudomonadota bacterium]